VARRATLHRRYSGSHQIINGELYSPITVDVWSSGITLYAMLCGYLPFDEDSKSLLYKKILACEYSIPRFVSQDAQDLLKRILVRNIHQRFTIEQIKSHPWFNQIKKKLPIGYISLKDKIPISRPCLKR
jgi:5'-AMP-activated protein kinase catalytic alpha subunit